MIGNGFMSGLRLGVTLVVAASALACSTSEVQDKDLALPELLSKDLPFQYPPELFDAGIEGQVALRLFVDSLGLVVPDSTRVEEPSTHPAFDSAAVAGAPFLEFRPAQQGGTRMGYSVVLPVQFRLPRDSGGSGTAGRVR